MAMNTVTSFANSEPSALTPAPITDGVKDSSFSVQVGVNVDLLALDLQVKNFYTFAAANIGVPLLTNGNIAAFAAGAGYTVALSSPSDSMWYIDFLGLANPARTSWRSSGPGSSLNG